MTSSRRLTAVIILVGTVVTLLAFRGTLVTRSQAAPIAQRTSLKVLRSDIRLSFKPTRKEIQDDQPPKPERFLKNTIPDHLPIKARIKQEKEKDFKDYKNDKWARDFELEVKNTGNKPIYYLSLLLVTDIKSVTRGLPLVFPLTFGNIELGEIGAIAHPSDVAIKPGETYVFQIHRGQLRAWEVRNQHKSNSNFSY